MKITLRTALAAHVIASWLAAAPAVVSQSARAIPVAHEVDVVVVGGSTGAVAAAVGAAGSGARVFVAAPKTYFGEDMCAPLRLWLEPGENAEHPLAKQIFSDWNSTAVTRDPVRPMHVKKTLDDALLAAKVPYLFSSYVTDVLRDGKGNLAGVVIANRAGRQAVLAKVIIDATPRASVARMAGARFRPYPAGTHTFVRYVVGGPVKSAPGVKGRALELIYRGDGSLKGGKTPEAQVPVVEYQLQIKMKDGSFASFAQAEQIARDLTFDEEQKAAADELFEVPPDSLRAARSARGKWSGAAAIDLEALRPSGVPRLYVLSGLADVPRDQAARLLRPPALVELGSRVGEAAARIAAEAPALENVAVPTHAGKPVSSGDIKETLAGIRGTEKSPRTVTSPAGTLPVLGTYDVVVIGGGTGGAPAGIAASRSGAKTLVVEYLHGLGGAGTLGMISTYWWGYRGGFTKEVPGTGSRVKADNPRFTWNPLHRSDWYRRTLRQAGGELWYGAIGAGAFLDGGQVKGAVVATPEGRGVILAKTVIDATGNADVAAAAGAPTVMTGSDEVAVQGTGLPSVNLGSGYTNTDFTIADETDMADVSHLFTYAKTKYSTQFDMGQLIDSRERRRILGDFQMSILDQMLNRTYPDTIAVAYSNFDTHGYTVHPYFLLDHPEKKGVSVNVPYRCLLPKGLDGMLVIGLGISVHRDAVPLVRMQPDIQNHGYAAGLAAATAARQGKTARTLDVKELQKQLVQLEIVPPSVLADGDSFPLTQQQIEAAIRDYPKQTHKAAVLIAQPEDSSPLLRKAYSTASDTDKFSYALALAVLGDSSGVDTLVAELNAQSAWDAGWRYTGMGQFGGALSTIDRTIVALGRTRNPGAIEAILRKAKQLTPDSEFSHYRAVALALESIGDKRAAGALAALLAQPGVQGHVISDVQQAAKATGLNVNETHTRGLSLRELSLARALYRCGDQDGLGKSILEKYAKDLRGHWARHAQAVLDDAQPKVK